MTADNAGQATRMCPVIYLGPGEPITGEPMDTEACLELTLTWILFNLCLQSHREVIVMLQVPGCQHPLKFYNRSPQNAWGLPSPVCSCLRKALWVCLSKASGAAIHVQVALQAAVHGDTASSLVNVF